MWHYVCFSILLPHFLGHYVWHYVGIMTALCRIDDAMNQVCTNHIWWGIM